MSSFRQINQQTLLLLSLLLSLALLCAQGAKLHAHDLDHGHDNDNENHLSHAHAIDEASDHSHMSKAHVNLDSAHSDPHGDVAFEIDVSPEGLLKNTNNHIVAIVLFALFFILMTFISSPRLVQRCRESKLILHSYYLLSPPLRAPPQH